MRSPHLPASPAHRSRLPGLRRWIRALLDLDEDTAVFLHEFAVPAAPAEGRYESENEVEGETGGGGESEVRTVISLHSLDGETRSWTVPRRLALLTEDDITAGLGTARLDTTRLGTVPHRPASDCDRQDGCDAVAPAADDDAGTAAP